jgi:hypothetical protein
MTQAVTTMGRIVHRSRGHTTGIISTYSDGWHRSGEHLRKFYPYRCLKNPQIKVVLCNQKISSSIKLSFSKGVQTLD